LRHPPFPRLRDQRCCQGREGPLRGLREAGPLQFAYHTRRVPQNVAAARRRRQVAREELARQPAFRALINHSPPRNPCSAAAAVIPRPVRRKPGGLRVVRQDWSATRGRRAGEKVELFFTKSKKFFLNVVRKSAVCQIQLTCWEPKRKSLCSGITLIGLHLFDYWPRKLVSKDCYELGVCQGVNFFPWHVDCSLPSPHY
jgi:hypothetical protein